ncbi:MAG: hypothetical protein KF884_06110 [Fimbriimonadaceae bacterium]|jgi:hypothetical protein|nr:hypothetical protein [Fimbriimonadaceae bacterium]QYK59659.1 MAG: hypothetical protein KF884_06110 [Fimbriimonadaceae bacterium]
MADPNDVAATKALRSELGRRFVDVGQADVRVSHGVAYIRGVVKPIKGGNPNVKESIDTVIKVIRQKGLVRDVVVDCAFRT